MSPLPTEQPTFTGFSGVGKLDQFSYHLGKPGGFFRFPCRTLFNLTFVSKVSRIEILLSGNV
jgi:hypothetical protein